MLRRAISSRLQGVKAAKASLPSIQLALQGNRRNLIRSSSTAPPVADPNVASETFKNRWAMAVPAFTTHLCIGSPWAWSLVADVLSRNNGFVAPAASDWSLYEAAFPLSLVFLMQGVCASVVGKWQQKVGPQKTLIASACCFGGGMLVGAAGIHLHSLPLMYAGVGFLGGTGCGLAYTPAVATLMEWFPDRKAIASGLTIAGFGCGSLVFTPLFQNLMKHFAVMPEYLGPAGSLAVKTVDGRLFAQIPDRGLVEAVQAGASELAKLPYSLPEGLYAVGTGSTGAAEGLAVMGMAYLTAIMASAFTLKKPHPTVSKLFAPTTTTVTSSSSGPPVAAPDVSFDEVMKANQFWLLGTSFFCISTGGFGLMSVAKPMMAEVFSASMPHVVTASFATSFVLMLSAGNLGGRLAWAALSEKIGRPKTFHMFMFGSVPIYLAMPTLVDMVIKTGGVEPLYAYCFVSSLAVSYMGGVFAILPAYEADLFGTKNVGPVHGRMLLFVSVAALVGPRMLTQLRSISEQSAVTDLLTKVDPARFQATFGAPMQEAQSLLAAKTLNISKLLALAPPGTLDPTPYLYDTTMYSLGGIMGVACVAHGLVRPLKRPALTMDTTGTVNGTKTLSS